MLRLKTLNVRPETKELLEENIGRSLLGIGLSDIYLEKDKNIDHLRDVSSLALHSYSIIVIGNYLV